MFFRNRFRNPLTITFAFVATHNHFVLDRSGKVFNRSAPVIKLPAGASEDDHLGLLGLLNSSTACFWMKSIFYPKGGDHVGTEGARVSRTLWDDRYEFTVTGLEEFPLASLRPLDIARILDSEAQLLTAHLPESVIRQATPTRTALDTARAEAEAIRARMIALQEELDWRCYRLYGLRDDSPEHAVPPPLRLGERAFEIIMARHMAAGQLETVWFTRHGSTPIIDFPADWPTDYRAIVERRIALIETDPTIGLIERPEYKRRWSSQPWQELEQEALRTWLLDRLEVPALWPTPAELLTTNQIADRIHEDPDFLSVAALYRGRDDYNLEALVAELVAPESVPFHAALRYTETGRRKRAQWEETWRLQRLEDAIDAEVQADRPAFLARVAHDLREARRASNPRQEAETPESYHARIATAVTQAEIELEASRLIAAEQKRRKQERVGIIPVPPKYISKDLQAQDYWRLRGGLDVPKERFVSFPGCSPDADGSLLVTWAGYDHLARALAIGSFFQTCKDELGWPAERLVPLLAGLHELLPWLIQWRNDAERGQSMGDYFTDMVRDEALALNRTVQDIAAWTPPTRPTRGRRRAA